VSGDPGVLGALRDAVALLLEARGARVEAAIVARGALHLLPGAQRWSIGAREVDAQSFELSLEARAFAQLGQLAGARDRVKDALSDAVATGATMLAELFIVLHVPETDGGWGHAYRSAPRKEWDPPTDGASVLAAAVALLDAEEHDAAARILERGRLSFAEVSSSGESPLRRWVVSLSAADMAEAHRTPTIAESLRRAVTLAATRPREIVASVELAVVAQIA
jgi:hypothetical protein